MAEHTVYLSPRLVAERLDVNVEQVHEFTRAGFLPFAAVVNTPTGEFYVYDSAVVDEFGFDRGMG